MNTTQPMRIVSALMSKTLLSAMCYWMSPGSEVVAGPISASAVPIISIRIEEPVADAWRYSPTADDLQASILSSRALELADPKEFSVLSDRTQIRVEELVFDPDPFVLNNVLVTNTTAMTQSYTVFVGLPTTFDSESVISGHVRLSVIDGGLDGATLATAGTSPIYSAQIDGTSIATLRNAPFSLVASSGSSAGSSLSTFGPIPYMAPVATDIGIQLRFALSAGDTAAILSRFEVVDGGIIVPEPSVLALILPGLFVSLRRRRDRQCRRGFPNTPSHYPRLE